MPICLIHQYYRTKGWKQETSMTQMLTRQIIPILCYATCLPGCVPKKLARRGLPPCSAQPAHQCSVIKASKWLLSDFVQRGFVKFIITQKANRTWWNESKSDVKIPTLREYATQGIDVVWNNFIFFSIFPRGHCYLFQKFPLKKVLSKSWLTWGTAATS